ncbi:FHIPEP family type III secretion protein [bacterium]|nr:FHIPEP family type III secretion protein [bacterium]
MLKLCTFLLLSLTAPLVAGASPEIDKVVASPVFEVRLGSDLAPLAAAESFTNRTTSIRRNLMLEIGWMLPGGRFLPAPALGPDEYKILSGGVTIGEYKLEANRLLAMGQEAKLANLPGPFVHDPTYGMPAKWIPVADKDKVEQMGFLIFDPVSVWATHMTELCRTRCVELYTADHLQAGFATLRKTQPVLVERVNGEPVLRDKLLAVIRNLLAEGVPVRDLETLSELVLASPQSTAESISEAARIELAGSVLKDLVSDGKMSVTAVGPKLEAAVLSNTSPDLILTAVKKVDTDMRDSGLQPILVTSSGARLVLRRLIQKDFPGLVVLSFEELLPYYSVTSVGTAEL